MKPDRFEIAGKMKAAGHPDEFITSVLGLLLRAPSALDLMELWAEADNQVDRDACVADLQEMLDDDADAGWKKPRISYNSLEDITTQVREHKARLKLLIDKNGGVTEVARKSGIPQPSLSRMLNSGSMPRRTTLHKIANAIGADEADIVAEWVR